MLAALAGLVHHSQRVDGMVRGSAIVLRHCAESASGKSMGIGTAELGRSVTRLF
jgi:hypothetical protein